MKRIALWIILLPLAGLADERILNYESDILVRQDGWIEVTETITVRAEGAKIRRGIYRDYPTRYRDRFGNDVEVRYEPRSVLRDGRTEDFHSERRGNGIRTYFGSAERLLSPGEYTYIYRYDAGRMLGFFDEHDELYWNITGLGWEFPIDRASATVSFDFDLPDGVLASEAYTGPAGAKGRAFRAATEAGRAHVETTAPLGVGEGVTIAVSWPKGHVAQPGAVQRGLWLLTDNVNLLVACAGLLGILGWYIPVWRRHGRDPEEGLIVTRYEPPDGFSPASLRFIERMGYDNKAMTAAIVNLAVKGYLSIEETKKDHALRKTEASADAPPLAAGERALLEGLFQKGSPVKLTNTNHEILGNARAKHRASLKRDYANRYFRTNGAMNLPALLIALAASVIALARGPTLFVVAVIVLMAIVIVVFAILMKRPTGLGRTVLDQAAGFRDYLEIAEKDEMNLRNPPEKTPELFERYLPFALAMGVEQRWAERFAAIFARLQGQAGASYHPAWYHGNWNVGNLGRSTAAMTSSLGSAISSSVTPPGSSSGSGGGGSSGGGGGGGGGGGW
jgi:uncharacterized membrane protein YgcG